jgi:hypothetical protein
MGYFNVFDLQKRFCQVNFHKGVVFNLIEFIFQYLYPQVLYQDNN